MTRDEARSLASGYAWGVEDATGTITQTPTGEPHPRGDWLFAQAYADAWDDYSNHKRSSGPQPIRFAYQRWQETGGRTIESEADERMAAARAEREGKCRPCRIPGHDTCGMVPGCPCCADALSADDARLARTFGNYREGRSLKDSECQAVLGGGEDDEDGRSQFVWVRLGNGDLILGVFPQGDTYFATEHRHADMVSRGGDYPDGI